MKVKIIITTFIASMLFVLFYYENLDNEKILIELEQLKHENEILKSKHQQNKDYLNFQIKRQNMLELYEGVKGFEKEFLFWDTLSFIKVKDQF